MIVKFVTECEIAICENTEDEDGVIELFTVGQTADFEIFGYPEKLVNGEWVEDRNYVNVQFADGSVAFGVGRDWYEEIKIKVEEDFTLSMYDHGMQIYEGSIPPDQTHLASFAETMSPLHKMIRAFANLPLGTKIKVTMEQV